MNCPHCSAALINHTGTKAGYAHCNECGCCLDANGDLRDGASGCAKATVAPKDTIAVVADAEPDDSITDIPAEVTRGTAEPTPELEVMDAEDSPTPERRTRRRKA